MSEKTLGDVIGAAILKHANQKGDDPVPMWKVIETAVKDFAKGDANGPCGMCGSGPGDWAPTEGE